MNTRKQEAQPHNRRLTRALLAALVIFVVHGMEEFRGELWTHDPIAHWFIQLFGHLSTPAAIFTVFHVMFWLLLTVILFIRWHPWGVRFVFTVIGLVMILEAYHLIFTFQNGQYFVGAWTAGLLVLCSLYYWYALWQEWRPHEVRTGQMESKT